MCLFKIIKDSSNSLSWNIDKSPVLTQFGQSRQDLVATRKKDIEDRIKGKKANKDKEQKNR
jgi:hypothetical protein